LQKTPKAEGDSVEYKTLQMFRVRAYLGGKVAYSLRVSAENKIDAELKTKKHLDNLNANYSDVIARCAGWEDFWT
jgi:hypothetical protein